MMFTALSLVSAAILVVQCQPQSAHGVDRQHMAAETEYQPDTQENIRQERQVLYKVSRLVGREPQQYHQYQYDPDQSYPSATQYQPSYSETPKNNLIRPKQFRQPAIEQYHKEVTPTTKTSYDPRTYHQHNAQTSDGPQGTVPKQAPFQYVLQSESQQLPYIQRSRYQLRGSPKDAVPQNVLAYQNALLAHQNAIYEQQRADQLIKQQQDGASKSAIYVSQNIQEQPFLKLVKPKPSEVEQQIDYYSRLQYNHLQQQSKPVFETKQPPAPKYQARIPQYSKPELLTTEEEQAYEPQTQYRHQTRFAKQHLRTQPQQAIRYHPIEESDSIRYQNVDPSGYEQPHLLQYQSQLQPQYSGGPKYLPEQKLVRYQEPVKEQYQQAETPSDDAVQKYRAAITAKHHSIGGSTAGAKQQVRPQPQYVQEEPSQPRYQSQQYEGQSQQGHQVPSDEDYKNSEFKQSLGNNSSLRLLKGKPIVFIGHEE